MSGSDPINWDLGNAPKQSITEVLQNPRSSSLELPDLPSFDLATPAPATPPPPPNINHFEPYLRRYTPLLKSFQHEQELLQAPQHQYISVPDYYYDPNFNVCQNEDLMHVALRLEPAETEKLRQDLNSYKRTLENTLHSKLTQQKQQISQALTHIRALRQNILQTVDALRNARSQVQVLLPTVTSGLCTARSLTAVQTNARALHSALNDVHDIVAVPEDVNTLLNTAEYSAAIDAVQNAKQSLGTKQLSTVVALAPVRGRLAQSVESIDSALREQFRVALREGRVAEDTLKHIVQLEGRIGRIPLLKAFFLKEVKVEVGAQVRNAGSLNAACRLVKKGAQQVLTLFRIVEVEEGRKEALEDLEEMLAGAIDQFLGTGGEKNFVVIKEIISFGEENCFDEFKAAMRFAEEVRLVEENEKELESLFGVERRGNAVRAKLSERQIAFVGTFHRAHVDALDTTIHSDRWQELTVPPGVLRLLAAVVHDEESGGNGEDERSTVVIGDNVFKTVASGVRYVTSMCAYVLLAERAPSLASEVARRATELTRLFNSLVGKAILGTAAVQWSGLRSITARHLSLASRTIAMAAALAERINQPLEKALSDGQKGVIAPLMQRSEKDLRDHHAQLLAKILAIMMERLDAHEGVLKSLPWEKAQEMQRFDMPSDYITTLVKEATVLHRILWSVLPRVEVGDIFQRICAAYGSHLAEAYGDLDGGKRWIRTRVAEDVTYLHERLKILDVLKENPIAFRPLAKLYDRFAKELKENGEVDAGAGRSFIVRKQPAPKRKQQSENNNQKSEAIVQAMVQEVNNKATSLPDRTDAAPTDGNIGKVDPELSRKEGTKEPHKTLPIEEQQESHAPLQDTTLAKLIELEPGLQNHEVLPKVPPHKTNNTLSNGSVNVPEGDLLGLNGDSIPSDK